MLQGGQAILDRLVHNAHPLNLSGESIRKLKPKLTREIDPA
jgi:DNA replication protein DnaC